MASRFEVREMWWSACRFASVQWPTLDEGLAIENPFSIKALWRVPIPYSVWQRGNSHIGGLGWGSGAWGHALGVWSRECCAPVSGLRRRSVLCPPKLRSWYPLRRLAIPLASGPLSGLRAHGCGGKEDGSVGRSACSSVFAESLVWPWGRERTPLQ